MQSNEVAPSVHSALRSRILLVVAHPDDESIGAGLLLQRNQNIHVVFCTSGAPNNRFIWRRFGSPWHYARTREREAQAALGIAHHNTFTFLRFRDGKLYRSLPKVYRRLASILEAWQPECIVTHAYEGGHQDHDACSFVSSRLAAVFSTQIQEMPLYHWHPASSRLVYQEFTREADGTEILTPTPIELATKQKMLDAHQSQRIVLKDFNASRELFRPQPQYDYLRPAVPGLSKMAVSDVAAEELIAAFRVFVS